MPLNYNFLSHVLILQMMNYIWIAVCDQKYGAIAKHYVIRIEWFREKTPVLSVYRTFWIAVGCCCFWPIDFLLIDNIHFSGTF